MRSVECQHASQLRRYAEKCDVFQNPLRLRYASVKIHQGDGTFQTGEGTEGGDVQIVGDLRLQPQLYAGFFGRFRMAAYGTAFEDILSVAAYDGVVAAFLRVIRGVVRGVCDVDEPSHCVTRFPCDPFFGARKAEGENLRKQGTETGGSLIDGITPCFLQLAQTEKGSSDGAFQILHSGRFACPAAQRGGRGTEGAGNQTANSPLVGEIVLQLGVGQEGGGTGTVGQRFTVRCHRAFLQGMYSAAVLFHGECLSGQRGAEYGEVVMLNRRMAEKDIVQPLRSVLRRATKEDIAHNTENRIKEAEALKACAEKIAAHKLDMNLVDAQYTFDNSKLLFYFTAEGRVDFRELVRDLAGLFRTRIELRQIGIRDESRLIGGLGMCGRPFCCTTFLSDFGQVSVKMAKEQGLSINTSKISGCCGRLMCCLRYEHESYAAEMALTPKKDTRVTTPDGLGTVVEAAPLSGMVKVRLDSAPDAAPTAYHRDTLTVQAKASPEGTEQQ